MYFWGLFGVHEQIMTKWYISFDRTSLEHISRSTSLPDMATAGGQSSRDVYVYLKGIFGAHDQIVKFLYIPFNSISKANRCMTVISAGLKLLIPSICQVV